MNDDALVPPKEKAAVFWHDIDMQWMEAGFWCLDLHAKSIDAFNSRFQPRTDDILLASIPKTGTTWLMALCHSILHRHVDEDDDALTRLNPHEVVPTLDAFFLADQIQEMLLLEPAAGPGRRTNRRLFHTHVPSSSLPEAVKDSGCKVVYVARNPKDTVVSMWHFYNVFFKSDAGGMFPLERVVESFCSGVMPYGPFYEHVVGYWEESRKRPEEVLFLRYEELCREPHEQVRKLASFLGEPFTPDGGDLGDAELDKVLWRSSIGRLRNLEVNKSGVWELPNMPKSALFRKGSVGDWKNYLTSEMAQRIDQLTRLKLEGTGLSLDEL
ncbi:unnamed protein product [Linum tenue]|uniref:Sulfotransferase n=1 Tax=Linum tenue TaxID=586396 RepID=A0AAV0GP89_9ROSI|nr:unnamed protein product [Linum tenue]